LFLKLVLLADAGVHRPAWCARKRRMGERSRSKGKGTQTRSRVKGSESAIGRVRQIKLGAVETAPSPEEFADSSEEGDLENVAPQTAAARRERGTKKLAALDSTANQAVLLPRGGINLIMPDEEVELPPAEPDAPYQQYLAAVGRYKSKVELKLEAEPIINHNALQTAVQSVLEADFQLPELADSSDDEDEEQENAKLTSWTERLRAFRTQQKVTRAMIGETAQPTGDATPKKPTGAVGKLVGGAAKSMFSAFDTSTAAASASVAVAKKAATDAKELAEDAADKVKDVAEDAKDLAGDALDKAKEAAEMPGETLADMRSGLEEARREREQEQARRAAEMEKGGGAAATD
jgi:hypothetical protein